ncbi:Hint domain-containing protein [Acidisoma cellulosilytica]|uniref:Hint domain-containing protein n=1 Tax=Acidisoma cellulosilyticum TaxID=2802395 RepID=A0A963YZ22_9PROT|nr:Hint domain-containing protein [Acidisoma cellulosilyticum]MCB8879778.1 Hint domain-containing protein [Acidisoma cellulosilyticum]
MTNFTNGNGVTYGLTLSGSTYTLVITYPAGGGSPQTITGIPAANVLTASGNLTVATSLGQTANYVIAPGASAAITMNVAILSTSNIHVGGSATIGSTVSLASTTNIYVDGGAVTAATGQLAGLLSGTNVYLDNGGTFGNGPALLSALNGTAVNFGSNGGTFVATGTGNPGSVIDLSSLTINGFSNLKDNIEFLNLASQVTSYSIAGTTNQTITLFNGSTQIGNVTVNGTAFPTGTVIEGQSGPLTFTYSGGNVFVSAGTSTFFCFLAGTRILTPQGEVAIEDLHDGDLVMTAAGMAAPITSLAVTRISTQFTNHAQIMPVKISAGAFADGLPKRDLYVSPDHSFFFDGVLVPAQLLINDSTIRQISRAGEIVYYHLELEPHDLIIAEGVATESFLDTGGQPRAAQGVVNLLPLAEPKTWDDACAPLLLAGPQLESIRARLQERAETVGITAVYTVAA